MILTLYLVVLHYETSLGAASTPAGWCHLLFGYVLACVILAVGVGFVLHSERGRR